MLMLVAVYQVVEKLRRQSSAFEIPPSIQKTTMKLPGHPEVRIVAEWTEMMMRKEPVWHDVGSLIFVMI
jgi:hypothetical protein